MSLIVVLLTVLLATILHAQVVTHGSEAIIQQEFVVFVVLAVTATLSFPHFAHNTHTRVLQPIISFCRGKPDGKFRWIFNLIHGNLIGWGVILLACECIEG